jgi:hypothetical protein
MKHLFYFRGYPEGRSFPRHLGLARYYGRTDTVLLLPIPLNWLVIGFDHAMHYLKRGRVLRCPHCKKAI